MVPCEEQGMCWSNLWEETSLVNLKFKVRLEGEVVFFTVGETTFELCKCFELCLMKHRKQADFQDPSSSAAYEGEGHALSKGLGTCRSLSLIWPKEWIKALQQSWSLNFKLVLTNLISDSLFRNSSSDDNSQLHKAVKLSKEFHTHVGRNHAEKQYLSTDSHAQLGL